MGAWQITKKDVWHLVRDRRALAVLVAFPLVFITLIGFSAERLLSWRGESQQIAVTLVNTAAGPLGRRVIEGIQANEALAVRVVTAMPPDDANPANTGTIVVFGPAFEPRMRAFAARDAGQPAGAVPGHHVSDRLREFDVTVHERAESGAAGAVVRETVLEQMTLALVEHLAPGDSAEARVLELMRVTRKSPRAERAKAATGQREAAAAPGGGVYQELVPSYTVLFAFFLVNIMARSFLCERDLGTLRRLRLAPLSPPSLLAGKTAPFLLLSVAQSVLLFLCGKLIYGMSWGAAPWLLIPVIICTSMAATSVGLLLATLVRTDSQVSSYANFLVLAMAGVSGCFLPRDWLPETMQKLSLVTPHAWSLIAYNQLLASPRVDVHVVGQCCLVLAAFSASFFLLGWRGFRRLA